MPKGLFSQGVALLTDGRTTIADVKSAIQAAGFNVERDCTAAAVEFRGAGSSGSLPA